MNHRHLVVAAAFAFAAARPAAAEEPPKAAGSGITFEALQVKAEELPKDIRVVEGTHPVEPHALSFYTAPTMGGAPVRKTSFSLAAGGRRPGTVFLFEYEEEVPSSARAFLKGLLWGGAPGPTLDEPEEMFVSGRFLVLTSFPYGDPAAEWFKGRLREKFGIPVVRRFELGPIRKRLLQAHEKGDSAAGLRILDENAEAVEGWAYGQYLRGEFCAGSRDDAGAEKAYARALRLHDDGTDLLGDFHLWGCLDGLGHALLRQGKHGEAVAAFRKACDRAGPSKRKPAETSVSDYGLARALALAGKWDESLAALRDAIGKRVSWRAAAREQRDLAAALLRPGFQALLRESFPPAPRAAPGEEATVTLAALPVPAAELPKDIRPVEGTPVASPAALAFYESPGKPGEFPALKGKACQALAAEGGRPGTVFLLEFDDEISREMRKRIEALVWQGKGRSPRNPEEVIVRGRFLIVLSFPRGDRAAEWFKDRLRKQFRIPAPRGRTELDGLFALVRKAYQAQDPDEGLRLLDSCAATVQDWSWGWNYRTEFGLMKQDWPAVERAATRALELHDSLEDPLHQELVWTCLDSLGMAQLNLRKLDAAIATLKRGKTYAEETEMDPAGCSSCDYNLACAYSLSGRWEECLEALRGAMAKRPAARDSARTDPDLEAARKRPEIQELLK